MFAVTRVLSAGRSYPIPPHLHHLGNDMCRGLLLFDVGKPLTADGLYWLKLHVANVWGEDKLSNEERVEFVEKHMEQVHEAASEPLHGTRWWMDTDDPFQLLAARQQSPPRSVWFSCRSAGLVSGRLVQVPLPLPSRLAGLHRAQRGAQAPGGAGRAARLRLAPARAPGWLLQWAAALRRAEPRRVRPVPAPPSHARAHLMLASTHPPLARAPARNANSLLRAHGRLLGTRASFGVKGSLYPWA